MGDNGRAIYQSLLAQTDTEARDDYEYDPRVQMYMNRRAGEADAVARQPTYSPAGDIQNIQESVADLARNHNEELALQKAPDTLPKSHTVLINTGYRDWTVQPDAYSNIFSFGMDQNIDLNGPQTPYYFNNVVVPLAAYETPSNALIVGAGVRNTYVTPANIAKQTFNTASGATVPTYFITQAQTYQPTYGWKIVLSNGALIHTPTPFSYRDANVRVYYYPTYNSANPRGAQLGIDIQPKLYGANQYNYSTSRRFSNVSSIRLIRATLPVRANQPWSPSAFSGSPIAYPDSFHAKSYAFMNIGSLNGGQHGSAQAVQRSFATLTQMNRNIYEPSGTFPSQYTDFYPWANESYTFDPPMRELSNANLQLVDEVGVQYSQIDNLNVTAMQIMTGLSLGKVKFYVANNSVSYSAYGDSNVFYGKDLRVGDEIVFYLPAVSQISSDSNSTPVLTALFQTFSNNYIVTDILSGYFATSRVLPIASYGTSFLAAPKISTINMGSVYSTFSTLSATTCNICLRSYASQTGSIPNTKTFSQDYVLPILNKNLQATFALEIITQEPDARKIVKMIPASE
jgi:hypothetical protein